MKHTVHTAKIMSYQVLSASIQQTGKGLVDYNRQRERTAGVRTCMAILQYQSRKLHSELFEIVSVTGFSLIFINRERGAWNQYFIRPTNMEKYAMIASVA